MPLSVLSVTSVVGLNRGHPRISDFQRICACLLATALPITVPARSRCISSATVVPAMAWPANSRRWSSALCSRAGPGAARGMGGRDASRAAAPVQQPGQMGAALPVLQVAGGGRGPPGHRPGPASERRCPGCPPTRSPTPGPVDCDTLEAIEQPWPASRGTWRRSGTGGCRAVAGRWPGWPASRLGPSSTGWPRCWTRSASLKE